LPSNTEGPPPELPDKAFMTDSPTISLIQNRLTVATLVLTVLVFSGSFSVALNAQLRELHPEEYRLAFAHLLVSIALGASLALAAIGGLLYCQQAALGRQSVGASHRVWFSACTMWLYLAASQAMSAGLTEVVFGVSLRSLPVAVLIAVSAYPVWLLLLFYAPLHLLMQLPMAHGARRTLLLAYIAPLLLILISSAEIYRILSHDPLTPLSLLQNFLSQIGQPLMWWQPW